MNSLLWGTEGRGEARASAQGVSLRAYDARGLEDWHPETGEGMLAPFDLLVGTSESARAKTAETFLELLGALVRNPNTRSAYRVAWCSFMEFCSASGLELESVKAKPRGA